MSEKERLPWCETCGAYSNPLENGDCGVCGEPVTWIETNE